MDYCYKSHSLLDLNEFNSLAEQVENSDSVINFHELQFPYILTKEVK